MKGLWHSNRIVRRLLSRFYGRSKHCEEQMQERLEDPPCRTQNINSIEPMSEKMIEEFNNILTTIMGCGKILQMKIGKYDPSIKYVKQILDAAERAAELTRSIYALKEKEKSGKGPRNLNKPADSAN